MVDKDLIEIDSSKRSRIENIAEPCACQLYPLPPTASYLPYLSQRAGSRNAAKK
jgi:hypothetical protein